MQTSSKGRQFIESFEGLILQAYDDANDHIVSAGGTAQGVLTIGYGHTSAAGAPTVHPGQVITKQQADDILASDLSKVEANVNKVVKVPLTQNQFDALVSFDFNTGALSRSSILTSLNNKNYDDAANRILLYNKSGGKVLAGLVRRREAEKKMFLSKDASKGIGPAGAVVVAGGTAAASQAHTDYWPAIIGITLVIAVVVWVGYQWHEFKKTQNVGNVPAVVVLPTPERINND